MADPGRSIQIFSPRAGARVPVSVDTNGTFSLPVVGLVTGINVVGGALLWQDVDTWRLLPSTYASVVGGGLAMGFAGVPFDGARRRTLIVFERGTCNDPKVVAVRFAIKRKRQSANARAAFATAFADEVEITFPIAPEDNNLCGVFIAAGTKPGGEKYAALTAEMRLVGQNAIQGQTRQGTPPDLWFVDFGTAAVPVPDNYPYTLHAETDGLSDDSPNLRVQQELGCKGGVDTEGVARSAPLKPAPAPSKSRKRNA